MLARVVARYPLRIPPYYAALIDPEDPCDPLAPMVLPSPCELQPAPGLQDDPLAEQRHMPTPRLVHRYRDRALLLTTLQCAAYCRHCTRKRIVGQRGLLSAAELRSVVAYLQAHPEVQDVLVSGGDPLVLEDTDLERVLAALRAVKSVRVLRVGTRLPAVLPMRITDDLAALLARHAPLYVSTHFNHPRELTPEARLACARLRRAGVPLANQTVLLAGVNDDAHTMEQLCRGLLEAGVRPYYLLQSDLTRGVEHLRTPLARGLEIMEWLRGRVSGLAIPTFVVDGPDGSGKMPLLPNYALSWGPGRTVLRNFEGQMVVYPDPAPRGDAGAAGVRRSADAGVSGAASPPAADGVAGLLSAGGPPLRPEGLERAARESPASGASPVPAPRPGGSLRIALVQDPVEPAVAGQAAMALQRFEHALTSLGHRSERAASDPNLPRRLRDLRPDVVVRVAARERSRALYVGALCEQLGLRALGPDCASLALLQRPRLRAALLRDAGIAQAPPPPAADAPGPPQEGRLRVLVAVLGAGSSRRVLRPVLLPLARARQREEQHGVRGPRPELSAQQATACEALALKVSGVLGLRDVGLVTLEVRADGDLAVAAVDPLPDLVTPKRPAPRLARALGIGAVELLRLALPTGP